MFFNVFFTTSAFHKPAKTNRHQTLKHLGQFRCYWNLSIIGQWGGMWNVCIWGDIVTLQQTGKLPKRSSRRNTTPRRGARTSATLFENKQETTICVSATIGIQIQQESPHLPSTEDKGSDIGRRMASGWQIYLIPGMLAITSYVYM